MHIDSRTGSVLSSSADTLVIYHFEGKDLTPEALEIDNALQNQLSRLLELEDFTGKKDQVAVVYPPDDSFTAKRIVMVGLGSVSDYGYEAVRRTASAGIKKAQELKAKHIAAVLHPLAELNAEKVAQASSEGYLLTLYNYQGQKSKKTDILPIPESLDVHLSEEFQSEVDAGITAAEHITPGVLLTRELVNLPPNICTAPYLADIAQQLAEETDLKVTVLDEDKIAESNMGSFLGVAQGSDTPPRFIILEHNADQADELDTIVFVGKGITFDTGGYNLKPAEGQGTMKADMAGAAAVIGAMRAVTALNPPVHVVGLAPAVDNMISGKAYRQQEVVTASNGVTIEIGNTDAEGRMLLADALVYAAQYNPAAVVDIATLTGSSVIALGRIAASLFSTDDALKDRLLSAAEKTDEKLWHMPLYPEYEFTIESQTADIKNTGGRFGGVGSSATFLKHFVSYPAWAHIDMAGMAMSEAPKTTPPYVQLKGATGYGVRLFAEFARSWES